MRKLLIFLSSASRPERYILVLMSGGYLALTAFGSLTGVSSLQPLYHNPAIYIPAIFVVLLLLSRQIITLLYTLDAAIPATFEQDLMQTRRVALNLAKDPNTTTFYATYLKPDAFSNGPVTKFDRHYWKNMEGLTVPDYRRIVGIYPNYPEYENARRATIEWIKEHLKKTESLKSYTLRYIEVSAHVVDIALNDSRAHYAFPYSPEEERGVTVGEPDVVKSIQHYYLRLWDSANDVHELLGEL